MGQLWVKKLNLLADLYLTKACLFFGVFLLNISVHLA